jgi:hypothetical protein
VQFLLTKADTPVRAVTEIVSTERAMARPDIESKPGGLTLWSIESADLRMRDSQWGVVMGLTRMWRVGLFLLALAPVHSALSEDFGTILRNADATEQGIYRAATDGQNPAAMYALGVMYDEGLGHTIDPDQAFRWYKLAAGHGHPEAMNRIGNMYAQARGVPQDYVAAAAWYQHAAQHGSVAGLNSLSELYFYGFGVPQSYVRAVKLLRSAIRTGDAAAENRLGALYESGIGVTRDQARAEELYRRSAQQGYTPGMVNLGLAYIEAIGVRRNDVQGYALVAAAVTIGIPDEMTKLASTEISEASARLDQQHLAQARVLARNLVAEASSGQTF